MNVLLVEDNPIDRLYFERVLRRQQPENCSVQCCGSLQETLNLCGSSSFDVAFLDLCLPDSEGLATLLQICEAFEGLPVVVLTCVEDEQLAVDALRCGAQDYLLKGAHLSGSVVARVLQHAREHHRHRQELQSQEQRHRHILGHVPACIWTTDEELYLTSATGATFYALGVEPASLIGLSLAEVIGADHPRTLQVAVAAHRAALRGEEGGYEVEWLGRALEVRVVPLRGTADRPQGVLGVAIDITERKRQENELSFARTIQESLLPMNQPEFGGFDIYGASYPALQTCGDWFDYLWWQDGSLGVVVGDVSGKGYGPAIMSAALASYLEAAVEAQVEPHEMVALCNRLYCKHSHSCGFAILSLLRLRPHQPWLDYIGAGESLLVLDRHGELKFDIPASGLPLGIFPHTEYDVAQRYPLARGDVLLALTDGFREAHAGDLACMFGRQRIMDTVRSCIDRPAREIFARLREECRSYCHPAPLHDDMTGVLVKVLC